MIYYAPKEKADGKTMSSVFLHCFCMYLHASMCVHTYAHVWKDLSDIIAISSG